MASTPRCAEFGERQLQSEITYAEITDDGMVRHPSFKRLMPAGAIAKPYGARLALERDLGRQARLRARDPNAPILRRRSTGLRKGGISQVKQCFAP
jgi:hypothetical protein